MGSGFIFFPGDTEAVPWCCSLTSI